ncbi:MAG: GMC family oxidoreductase [Candidatus Eremiobacteraeota bacterium]|nr:GMC family oxidoreductase [Candidatus Eremiobacteraeota bacterium]
MQKVSPDAIADKEFDVVVVGGGVAGALVAKRVSHAGRTVLLLEAGTGEENRNTEFTEYLGYVNTFYAADIKIPQSPFQINPNANEALETDVIPGGTPYSYATVPDSYFKQRGRDPFLSTYTRYLGGTTLHWVGTSLRMLPEDFELYSRYGVGRDWPISYRDLMPYYDLAELELAVSADVDDQRYLGIEFTPDYQYPMHRVPLSWGDKVLGAAVDGMAVRMDGESYDLSVTSTPAARNSTPNTSYVPPPGAVNPRVGYEPDGAVGNPAIGHRCMGNSSCTPICPIQAKYNARKTLIRTHHDRTTIVTQAVVTELLREPGSDAIGGVKFKHYASPDAKEFTEHVARGKTYVLAAHAVENAKILHVSNLANGSDQVGRNLMDHPCVLMWALAPKWYGGYRGPVSTAGIESLRGGSFRAKHGAFRIEIGNDGWSWPVNGPFPTVTSLVQNGVFGTELRHRLFDQCARQFRIASLVEQLPDPANRVTFDPKVRDSRGDLRPIITYSIDDYVKAGAAAAFEVGLSIFDRFRAEDATKYSPADSGSFLWKGKTYEYQGAGHLIGTHRMGDSPHSSVVDARQRSWDHHNLYLVGCGNFVTEATSNPTLTLAALTLMAADNVLADLGGR